MGFQEENLQRLIQEIVAPRPFLFWHVADKTALSERAIIEAVLNAGDFDDFHQLCDILGIHRVAKEFVALSQGSRTNLKPKTIHFFRQYFNRHVPEYSQFTAA